VAPARRVGIGTALIHACLALARDRGLGRAALTSSPDGHGIYRRLGFRDCCTVSRYRFPPAS
jgi:GNAT superfamily N-acetyltransferase